MDYGATQDLDDAYGSVLSTFVLANMKERRKKDILMIPNPMRIRKDRRSAFLEDYPLLT